jgi:hypothetical protein
VNSPNDISRFLGEVHRDWETTQGQFPNNTHPPSQWPIPFFGNPATALVATVGVNPSSDEFNAERHWDTVTTKTDWKLRLRDYFRPTTPPHEWFESWRIGLAVLGVSYEEGTAAHIDLSYRSTTAMLTNRRTDRDEFRRMVEHDVAFFFRLLLLSPKLRLLLTFGPIVAEHGGQPESLLGFLFATAPQHGFKMLKYEDEWKLWHMATSREFVVHDADTPGEKCVTCRVVKNLVKNRDALRAHGIDSATPGSSKTPLTD